jgi:hypothetical protein
VDGVTVNYCENDNKMKKSQGQYRGYKSAKVASKQYEPMDWSHSGSMA